MAQELITPLAEDEKKRRKELEKKIAANINGVFEIGMALWEIREQKLYREDFSTFEDYCKERWEFTHRYARYLVQGAEVLRSLSQNGTEKTAESKTNVVDESGTMVPLSKTKDVAKSAPLPSNERQLRALAKVPENKRKAVWDQVVAEAGSEKVTAKHVGKVVREHVPSNDNPRRRLKQAHERGLVLKGAYGELCEMSDAKIREFLDLTGKGHDAKDALAAVKAEKPAEPDEPLTDEVGIPLSGKMVEVFAARAKFKELRALLRQAQGLVNDLADGPGGDLFKHPTHSELHWVGASGEERWKSKGIEECLDKVNALQPFASACPWCQHAHAGKFARECKACFGRGWVIRRDWNQAPDDYREAVLAAHGVKE